MSKDKRPVSDVVKAVANLGLNFTEGRGIVTGKQIGRAHV